MPVTVNIYNKLGPRVGADFFADLETEGIEYDSGKVWVTFTSDSLRGKGIIIKKVKRLSRGRLLITSRRFIAVVGGHKLIDVPKDSQYFRELEIDRSNPEQLEIKVDLVKFPSKLEGVFRLVYKVDLAQVP